MGACASLAAEQGGGGAGVTSAFPSPPPKQRSLAGKPVEADELLTFSLCLDGNTHVARIGLHNTSLCIL